MIVFSDLDRSIIYSKRFLKDDTTKLEIEIYNGKNILYIKRDS